MATYVLRRVLQTVPVLLLASIAILLSTRLLPGDPAVLLAGPDATPEGIDALRHQFGLDAPLPVQYGIWLERVAHADLGRSFVSRQPVWQLIQTAAPATVELTLAALGIALLFGIPTGIAAAVARGKPTDWLITGLNAIAVGVPNFWVGILLIIVFALILGVLPPGGRVPFVSAPGTAWRFLLLPAVTLGLPIGAELSRFTRAAMLEVLHEDYIRTARAKGLSGRGVVLGHGLRNALVPIVTVLGIYVGRLLGGAVIVENIFAWPGIGRLVVQAVISRDYLVVQGSLLLLVLVFILVNLLVDLLYGVLDPRLRLATAT